MSTIQTASTAPRSVTRTQRSRRILQSAGAVLAGLAVNVILGTAIDAVLHAAGVYPPYPQRMADGLFGLALGYRLLIGVAGGYATARLAADRPMRHALALGAVGVAISTAGAVAMGDFGPAWYSLALIALAVPCSLAGARLYGMRRRT